MYAIEQLIPHRPPMVLLDKLLGYDQDSARCEVRIHPDCPFFDPAFGGVPGYVGIEYMAQAIAAFAGAQALDAGQPIQIGFLLGSRKFQCHRSRFTDGMALTIEVTQLHKEESGLGQFDCTILHGQQRLCEARINVFQPANAGEYVKQANGEQDE